MMYSGKREGMTTCEIYPKTKDGRISARLSLLRSVDFYITVYEAELPRDDAIACMTR